MINNGQDAVVSSAPGESRDQVHSNLGKGWHIVGYRDFVLGDLYLVREVLVLLTGRASFHILLDPRASAWPAELVQDFPGRLVLPQVHRQPIVVGVHDASSYVLVWGYDYPLVSVHPQASFVGPL